MMAVLLRLSQTCWAWSIHQPPSCSYCHFSSSSPSSASTISPSCLPPAPRPLATVSCAVTMLCSSTAVSSLHPRQQTLAQVEDAERPVVVESRKILVPRLQPIDTTQKSFKQVRWVQASLIRRAQASLCSGGRLSRAPLCQLLPRRDGLLLPLNHPPLPAPRAFGLPHLSQQHLRIAQLRLELAQLRASRRSAAVRLSDAEQANKTARSTCGV